MCCKLATTFEAASIGSTAWWGRAAWPPFPLIVASKKPLPAKKGPGLEATSAKGIWFATCNPKIASTFSNAPASNIFLAPPPPSSAGWNTRTTVPYWNENILIIQGNPTKQWSSQEPTPEVINVFGTIYATIAYWQPCSISKQRNIIWSEIIVKTTKGP